MTRKVRSIWVLAALLVALVALWLSLPWVASAFLERWLERQGFAQVTVRLDYPGLQSLGIPEFALTKQLDEEAVSLSFKNTQLRYALRELLAGHIDQVLLEQVSVEIKKESHNFDPAQPDLTQSPLDAANSPSNALTLNDLMQSLPIMPCNEVRVEHLRLFREQATGPLQTLTMTGSFMQRKSEVSAEVSFRGIDTKSYELLVTGRSASDMSFRLGVIQEKSTPIVLWKSESVENDSRTLLKGVVEVDVQELAPFLALALPIGLEWRQVGGTVSISWVGTAASGIPIDQLWADAGTAMRATVHVDVSVPELRGVGGQIAVDASGTVEGNARLLHWTIEPGTLAAAMVSPQLMPLLKEWSEYLPAAPQPVVVKTEKEVSGDLFLSDQPPRFSLAGPLTVTYGSPKGPVFAELQSQQLSGRGRGVDQAEGYFRMRGNLPEFVTKRVGVARATGHFHGSITMNRSVIDGVLHESSSLTFTGLRQDPILLTGGKIQLSEALPIHLDAATGQWGAGPGNSAVQLSKVNVAKYPVIIEQTTFALDSLEGNSETWNVEGVVDLRGMSLTQSGGRTLPTDMTVRINADPDVVNADISVRSRVEGISLTAQLKHQLKNGSGNLEGVVGPILFDRAEFRLRQLISSWPYPFDVTNGLVTAAFSAAWSEGQRHRVQLNTESAELTIEKLGGHFRNVQFSGLSTKMNLTAQGRERISIDSPSKLTVDSINAGVEVRNVAMSVQGEWDLQQLLPVVEVRGISCELLGAAVTSEGGRADLAHPPFAFTVVARHLDLEQVLSLEQQEGLDGSGLIDGSLPFTVTDRGVIVKDGQFEARPPGGRIRYAASPEATTTVTEANANMRLVLQALSNFHYNVLQVGAEYEEDGTLKLKTRLEGKNPDQKKSPPIHFNLTVQENIPALLKSLRLVQDIEDSVQKKFVKP